MEDAAGSDFARVKSLWQTRVTRAASREAPPAIAAPAAAPVAAPVVAPVAAARGAALSPRAKPARSDKPQPQQKQHKQPEAPHTPAPDEYFYAREKRDGDGGDVVENAQLVPSPVSSSTSTMSVSPSKSVTPVTAAPVSVVNSVLRRVSDATMRTRSTSGANNSGVVAIGSDGAASNESSPKEGGSHLSLSSIPVPDISSWKGKMMSYSSRGSKHSPPSSANSSTTSAPTTSKLSLSSISTTWKSMSAHTMKAALNEMNAPVDGVELAKNNIHSVCSKTKPYAGNNALTIGSPYGELIVVEVLAARELSIRDDGPEGADARPFATVEFNSVVRKSLAPRHTSSNRTYAFNERFVFWVPSSPTIDQQNVSFTFHQMADRTTSNNNKNSSSDDDESHLGEVHLSLAMPVNEVFDDWFPLVRPIDGAKKGSVHIGLRRLVLTSPTLLEAAKTLASRNRSLNIADKNAFGATLPELWEGFTDAQDESTGSENTSSGAASSMSLSRLGKPTELLASKFNGLSRRFTGGSAADVRRDVF